MPKRKKGKHLRRADQKAIHRRNKTKGSKARRR